MRICMSSVVCNNGDLIGKYIHSRSSTICGRTVYVPSYNHPYKKDDGRIFLLQYKEENSYIPGDSADCCRADPTDKKHIRIGR